MLYSPRDMARRRKRGGMDSSRGKRDGKGKLPRGVVYPLAVVGGLLLILLIAYFSILSYLQGREFRDNLCYDTAVNLQAQDVVMDNNLSIDGDRVSELGLVVTGMQGVERISANGMDATLERAALLHRILRVSRVTLNGATVLINPASQAYTERPPREKSGLIAAISPQTVQVDRVECRDATITLRLKGGEYSYTGARLSARPATRGQMDAWNVEGINGRMHTSLSFLKDCSVKGVNVHADKQAVEMTDCRLMLSPGEMGFKARYSMESKEWNAEMQVNKADVARILKEDWKKLLTGQLFGKMVMNGDADGISLAEGNLTLREGVLEALPILSEITVGNTKPYRRLPLERASCHISFPYSEPRHQIEDAWRFDKIDIRAAEGRLLVRGHIIIGRDSELRGTLNVGIPMEMVAKIPLGQEAGIMDDLFNAVGDPGYAWVTINLSGTTDNPKEDLSVRLSTLLGSNLPKAALKKAGDVTRDFLSRLTGSSDDTPAADSRDGEEDTPFPAPDRLLDQQDGVKDKADGILKKAGDAAGDLINKGLNSFF